MKKNLTLLLLSFIICTSAFSQTEDRKGYIGVSVGTAFPVGLYGSTDPTNDESGYAVTGGLFEVSFAYKLGQNFGIEALLRGQRNGLDAQALANQAAQEYPNVNWTVTTNSWGTGGLMGGIYGTFPTGTNSRNSFEMRLLVGLFATNSPDATFTGEGGNQSITLEQTSGSVSSFAILLGIGLRHDFSATTALLVNLDYLGTSPQFEGIETTTSVNGFVTTASSTSFTQPLTTVNLSVGIAFRIK